MIHPVIMAGGSGSRLWPLSRQLNPKQFLTLTDEHLSMLQLTTTRLTGLDMAEPLLICNEEHRFLAAEQMRQSGYDNARILLEPCGRNTAPAIALAALRLIQTRDDTNNPLMLVLPADHLVQDTAAFQRGVANAASLAAQGKLVTFGVRPGHAETDYGYIQRGQPFSEDSFEVSRFVEKPDQDTAERYFSSGDYLWNSGIFLFGAATYLQTLKNHRPDILSVCEAAMEQTSEDLHFTRVDGNVFAQCPDDSIDYAVMEKTDNALVVSLDAGWSDIGSWSALWNTSTKDEQGNSFAGDVIAQNTENTLVRADSRLVATVGVKDLVIVETSDALLVAQKDEVRDVKKVVEVIRKEGRHEHMNHREVYRPWGVYDAIASGSRYQVKRITVKPGGRLSTQMHHHRAEHWVVVSGTARVTRGDTTFLVTENQSTYIPVGEVHSLENPGAINLEVIEVQSGPYLGEDDIVRFQDKYVRP